MKFTNMGISSIKRQRTWYVTPHNLHHTPHTTHHDGPYTMRGTPQTSHAAHRTPHTPHVVCLTHRTQCAPHVTRCTPPSTTRQRVAPRIAYHYIAHNSQVEAFSHFSEIHPSSFYVVTDGHDVDEDEVKREARREGGEGKTRARAHTHAHISTRT